MKKIVFVVAFTVLLKPLIPVAEYFFNYDYITAELCENKDNPVMACNGKCYLMKELAKASETEKPISSEKKQSRIETIDFFMDSFADYESVFFTNLRPYSMNAGYANLYANLFADSFFHPPAGIS